jgi:hydrogenase maturation factor
MNDRIKEIMIQAEYPAPDIALRAQKLTDLIIKDLIKEIESVNIMHGCGTTYDLSVAQGTREVILKHIKKEYDIKYNFLEKL